MRTCPLQIRRISLADLDLIWLSCRVADRSKSRADQKPCGARRPTRVSLTTCLPARCLPSANLAGRHFLKLAASMTTVTDEREEESSTMKTQSLASRPSRCTAAKKMSRRATLCWFAGRSLRRLAWNVRLDCHCTSAHEKAAVDGQSRSSARCSEGVRFELAHAMPFDMSVACCQIVACF